LTVFTTGEIVDRSNTEVCGNLLMRGVRDAPIHMGNTDPVAVEGESTASLPFLPHGHRPGRTDAAAALASSKSRPSLDELESSDGAPLKSSKMRLSVSLDTPPIAIRGGASRSVSHTDASR
jgi:hypothetical protein